MNIRGENNCTAVLTVNGKINTNLVLDGQAQAQPYAFDTTYRVPLKANNIVSELTVQRVFSVHITFAINTPFHLTNFIIQNLVVRQLTPTSTTVTSPGITKPVSPVQLDEPVGE